MYSKIVLVVLISIILQSHDNILVQAQNDINTLFNSATDIDVFPYRTGSWAVTGGALQSTSTGTPATLLSNSFNLHDGFVIFNINAPMSAPTGFGLRFGVRLGGQYSVHFEHDGWGLKVHVLRWGKEAAPNTFIAQYNSATHAWLRIGFASDQSVSFGYSSTGETWTTFDTGVIPALPSTWSHKALQVFVDYSPYQKIASSTVQLKSVFASGFNTNDRTHIDPAPATLIVSEDFDTLNTSRWEVDDSPKSLVSGDNFVVSDGAVHFGISNGYGARAYWGAWKPLPPPVARYGRYEFRMKYTQAVGAGPAVMIWPASDVWAEGELDVFEGGEEDAHITVHWFPSGDTQNDHQQHQESLSLDYTVYHVWTFEWTPTLLRGWIDGRLVYYSGNTAEIPDTDFDIRIHNRFYDGVVPTGSEKGSLDIDYIKVYYIPATTILRNQYSVPSSGDSTPTGNTSPTDNTSGNNSNPGTDTSTGVRPTSDTDDDSTSGAILSVVRFQLLSTLLFFGLLLY